MKITGIQEVLRMCSKTLQISTIRAFGLLCGAVLLFDASSTAYGSLPNLVPQNITLGAGSVVAGGTLTVNWTLANTGSGNSPGTVTGVRFNQSTSSSESPTLTNVVMQALAASSSVGQSATINIPANTAPGTYYVWILADNVLTGGINQTSVADDIKRSVAFTVGSQSAGSVIGFDYPIGTRGYDGATPVPIVEFPSGVSPSSGAGTEAQNMLYSGSGAMNPKRENSGVHSGWWVSQDVGAFLEGYGIHSAEDWNYGSNPNDDIGMSVFPTAVGKIVQIRGGTSLTYWTIVVQHELGGGNTAYSIYGHVAPLRINGIENNNGTLGQRSDFEFAEGASVVPTEPIARIGNLPSGPHLHFEIRVNTTDYSQKPYFYAGGPTQESGQNSMTQQEVAAAYAYMRAAGFVDPSDFIDAHRQGGANESSYLATVGKEFINESDGQAIFTVKRTGATPSETVYVSTTESEGFSNDGDFGDGIRGQPLSFAAGETSKSVIVPIYDDGLEEGGETFGFIVQRNAGDSLDTYLAKTRFNIQDPSHGVPVVKVAPASSIAQSSATMNAVIVSNGGSLITETLFEWSRNTFPGKAEIGTQVSGNQISFNLTGLQPNTSYSYRIYAKNSSGWGSSANSFTFTTGSAENSVVKIKGVPYIHQLYDTSDDFSGGGSACNAAAALMAIQYFGRLPASPIHCSRGGDHISDYGVYISSVYSYKENTFDVASSQVWGNTLAGYKGGFGWFLQDISGDSLKRSQRLSEYISKHDLYSEVDDAAQGEVGYSKIKSEIDSGNPVVILTSLTGYGHYVTCIGYVEGQHTLIIHDPFGDKKRGYPNKYGESVYYDWPTYNNGNANLTQVYRILYCRNGSVDNAVPFVSILEPISGDTVYDPSVTLSGLADDDVGVAKVTWQNNRGGNGVASGTTAWAINSIQLQRGQNVISVFAHDGAGKSSVASISITYTPSDITPPTLEISRPTVGLSDIAPDNIARLSGTATDDSGIARIDWFNDRGGSGSASGTTAWEISTLELKIGINKITVSAVDLAGNVTIADVAIVYSPSDSTPPTVSLSAPTTVSTYFTDAATLSLSGVALDDSGITRVEWVNSSGGFGVASGTSDWNVDSIYLQEGENEITLSAFDTAGNQGTRIITVSYLPQASQPENDDFDGRIRLVGLSIAAIGSSLGATVEASEPIHAGSRHASIWFSWEAPVDGDVVLSTLGSAFDTVIDVLEGTSFEEMVRVVENDDAFEDHTSEVRFTAVRGHTYQIAIDGYQAETGVVRLNLDCKPLNFAVSITEIDGLNLYGIPGMWFALEESLDFSVWTSVATNRMPSSGMLTIDSFVDFLVSAKFYRLAQLGLDRTDALLKLGYRGDTDARSVSALNDGFIAAGSFAREMRYGGAQLNAIGLRSAYVVKILTDGTLGWISAIQSTNQVVVNGVVAKPDTGEVYVTGAFLGQATFGSTNITGSLNGSIFLAKLNSSGGFEWVRKAGGAAASMGLALTLDVEGNLFFTGACYGPGPFWDNHSFGNGDQYDAFVAKVTPNGSMHWLQNIEGNGSAFGKSVAVDGQGNIFVAGQTDEGFGFSKPFLAKFNLSGGGGWQTTLNSTAAGEFRGVGIDATGSLVAVGTFSGTVSHGGNAVTSVGLFDALIVRFGANGTPLSIQSFGGSGIDELNGVTMVDTGTEAIGVGSFQNNADVFGKTVSSAGDSDGLLVRMNLSGELINVITGGGLGNDSLKAVNATDTSSRLYSVGNFAGILRWDSIEIKSGGTQDGIVINMPIGK